MSTAVMIMPGVQKPHCNPWCSRNASCIGCSGAPSAASPSMVFTSWPSAITVSVVHDFTALPSRCTTQAPHCEVSQPTWVPVRRRCSRRNCTRRVRGSTFAVTGLPLTIRETLAISTLLICAVAYRRRSDENHSRSHNMGPSGVEQPQPKSPRYDLTLYRLCEIGEELVGQFLGRAVDQAPAELGQLAADLRLDVVAQKRAAVLVGKRHDGAALGEAGDPALALARDLVAVGRIEIAQGDLALEARRYRANLHLRHGAKAVVVGCFQLFTAGDAGLQYCRIVQLGPHRFPACR